MSSNAKKSKVGFHELIQLEPKATGGHRRRPATCIPAVLNYVIELLEVDRKYNLTADKYCKLVSLKSHANDRIFTLVFKSATSGTRYPLMDRQTAQERPNPKNFTEGETVKTHMALVVTEQGVILINQRNRSGVSVKHLMDYVWHFMPQYAHQLEDEAVSSYNLEHHTIVAENFLERLDSLTRLMKIQLYVDKEILGSDEFNRIGHIEEVQDSIMVEVKALRSKNIKQTAIDAFNSFRGQDSRIRQVRAIGKNTSGNEFVIDTSFMEKIAYLEANIDTDTGDFHSIDYETKLLQAAQTFLE